jgi:hypothetical protein
LSGHGFGQKRVSTEKDKGEVTMQIGKEMAIPSILKIGNGALGKIGGYLKAENLDQVVLFFGNGLIDMFGELVMNSLKEAEVNVLEYNELDTVDIDDIITLAFAIPNKAKAVISIGGGKVIDAGKYAAFLRNLPFISVPTSSSSDGFSSASASLLVQGKRTSVPASFFISWLLLCCFCFFCSDKYSVICLSGITAVITHFGMVRWNFPHAHRPFPDSASSYLK